jgi:hypothetical protein
MTRSSQISYSLARAIVIGLWLPYRQIIDDHINRYFGSYRPSIARLYCLVGIHSDLCWPINHDACINNPNLDTYKKITYRGYFLHTHGD